MAQLDEFGRPIYETAEEYNKAKKAAHAYHTYECLEEKNCQQNNTTYSKPYQSTSQRHATKSASEKAKKMVLVIVGLILATNIGVIVTIFNSVGMFEDSYQDYVEESWTESVDGYGEYIGDDTTPLPDGFETFSYNGEVFSLPTYYEDILRMGFTVEEGFEENEIVGAGYESLLLLNEEDGYMSAMIRVINETDMDIPLKKCKVDYFYIDNPAAYDIYEECPDFEFGEGLTFESTYEDIEAYLGIPYYHYEDRMDDGTLYESYDWAYYGEDEIHYVNIIFYNGVMSEIGIEKKAYMEKF